MSFHKVAPVKNNRKAAPAPKRAPQQQAKAEKAAAPKRRPVSRQGR
ncbi:hypothetical protein ACFV6E_10145 [Streptomyces sp. NPDC059785]